MGLKPLSPKKLNECVVYLGASFIKLAQVLATRADFFSKEYLEELKSLHDSLPPMKNSDFQIVFNCAFSSYKFKEFNETPIASASIGQVHIAYLESGEKVAVKLRRYGIAKMVSADIKIISVFNFLFKPLFSKYTKNSIEAVISEFAKMILQEVNLSTELANLQKFSAVYADSGVRFPQPYPNLCSEDALVMSFEEGFRFDDKESLLKQGIDFKPLIKRLVDFYTAQMLINGYFHADPHPGNLLVNKSGELILLDFGMVKSVPSDIRVAIIELLQAANEKNYELYISANKRLGTIAYEAPTSELAAFCERMFEIFGDDNLSSESMQKLAFNVMESTRDLPFKLPSDAIYILRVSAIIEGLGTTYIENFNGIKDILPILQKNIPKALGAKDSIVETIFDEFKELPIIAKDMKTFVKKISNDSLQIELSRLQLEWLLGLFKQNVKSYAISFATIAFSFFLILFDKDLKFYALFIFLLGFLRLLYKN